MEKSVIEQVLSQMTLALTAVLAVCTSLALFGCSHQLYAAEKKHEVVQDPRYGVALWHYFQGQHMDALTELMIAEDANKGKKPIQGHGDNPKIMKSALELAYGMVNHSKAAFESIADESLSPSVKGKAWYYLARIYYQRGDLANALSSLENSLAIDGKEGNTDLNLSLKLNILIQQTDFIAVERLIDSPKKQFTDKAMALFNLGNAYSRKGDYRRALNSFDRALVAIKQQEEISQADLLLADKIYTSAGYSALFFSQPKLALSYFSQSQQQSLDSDLALLGYGRAAVELEHYPQALNLFGRLAQQAPYKTAVQESLVNVPVIYEKIQKPARALTAYEHAIAVYQQEILNIDTEIGQLKQQNPVSLFSSKTENAKNNSHWLENSGVNLVSPDYLIQQKFSELFSESVFQAELRELKDLISLNDLAVDRLERLSMLKDSLINRQEDRQSQWLKYGALQAEQKLEAYRKRLKQMTGLLEKAVDEKDYLALIPDNRKELLERIENSEQRIGAHNQPGANLQKQKNLLRVYKGMLFWQAAQDYAEEKHTLEKAVHDMERELEVLTTQQFRVARILSDDVVSDKSTSEDFYLKRIEQLERYTSSISSGLDRKIAQAKAKVFGSMVALLEDRQQKLRQYMTHARLASLRIYEESSLALNTPAPDSATGTGDIAGTKPGAKPGEILGARP